MISAREFDTLLDLENGLDEMSGFERRRVARYFHDRGQASVEVRYGGELLTGHEPVQNVSAIGCITFTQSCSESSRDCVLAGTYLVTMMFSYFKHLISSSCVRFTAYLVYVYRPAYIPPLLPGKEESRYLGQFISSLVIRGTRGTWPRGTGGESMY